jgi:hypothetical protein
MTSTKVVPLDSPLIAIYQAKRKDLNGVWNHAFPSGAVGDANGLHARCPNCSEEVNILDGDDLSPVTFAPHGRCAKKLAS